MTEKEYEQWVKQFLKPETIPIPKQRENENPVHYIFRMKNFKYPTT